MTATLCIDAGTSLIKAVVFDDAGKEVVVARRPTRVITPGGARSEQNMADVWTAVVAASAEAVAAAGVPIGAIAITAQGDGAWFVDSSGAPVGNAILWNDGRATAILEAWTRSGVVDRAFAINGSASNLGLPNTIMAHLLAESPRALDPVQSVLTCGSWLYLQLTGERVLHVSDASAPWLDIHDGTVSAEALGLFGLDQHASLIPPAVSGSQSKSQLSDAAARLLGAAPGTPVVLAPYDVVTTAAGSGAVSVGDAFAILGTTICSGAVVSSPDSSGSTSGLTLRIDSGEAVTRAFPSLAGTGILDWLSRMLGVESVPELAELAGQSRPGSAGVRVWPYFSPAGERNPFVDTHARGVIAGLSFDNSQADVARAALESLAHVVREGLEATGHSPAQLSVSGGGSASDLWCSIIADVTGVPTVRTTDSQVGAKGALVHAGVTLGSWSTTAESAAALVTVDRIFQPDPAVAALHDDRHRDFVASREALAERWREWPRDE